MRTTLVRNAREASILAIYCPIRGQLNEFLVNKASAISHHNGAFLVWFAILLNRLANKSA